VGHAGDGSEGVIQHGEGAFSLEVSDGSHAAVIVFTAEAVEGIGYDRGAGMVERIGHEGGVGIKNRIGLGTSRNCARKWALWINLESAVGFQFFTAKPLRSQRDAKGRKGTQRDAKGRGSY
jgi:hypothetical protein